MKKTWTTREFEVVDDEDAIDDDDDDDEEGRIIDERVSR